MMFFVFKIKNIAKQANVSAIAKALLPNLQILVIFKKIKLFLYLINEVTDELIVIGTVRLGNLCEESIIQRDDC